MVASSIKLKRQAIAAVSARFGSRRSFKQNACALSVAGKPVALVVIVPRLPRTTTALPAPRLRFDRVVIRVLGNLRAALGPELADNRMLVLTLTAPIKRPAKTAAALEDCARVLIARRITGTVATTVHGNQIQMGLLRSTHTRTSNVLGFVHHRDSDPALLFALTAAFLRSMARVKPLRSHAQRWLVIAHNGAASWSDTYAEVCCQLIGPNDFSRLVLVAADATVSEKSMHP